MGELDTGEIAGTTPLLRGVDTKINKKAGGKEIGCTQSLETQWTM
jgi:hypothetical protein